MPTTYIANEEHFKEVLKRMESVKHSLWIGTADIKDLYIKVGMKEEPLLALLAKLLKRGVNIRLIHAKEPGPIFREEFDKYPLLAKCLERVLCPRVHFKLIVFDNQLAYIGSANLTGAGMGMKSARNRNFEAGILTDEPSIVDKAAEQFDDVWIGRFCKDCGKKQYCGDPILSKI